MNVSAQIVRTTTTYRLRGIPYHSDRSYAQRLIRGALNLNDDVEINIRSFADGPFRYGQRGKVATLTFSEVPPLLMSTDSEWKLEYSDYKTKSESTTNLIFDTHFHGFTPLHVDNDADCEVDLVAVSGLGGHAFGSFKERSGSFMWLRDCLPIDLPGVRIFIYGHDSTLAGSESFQTTLDLGKKLQSALQTIRGSLGEDSDLVKPLVLLGHSLGGIIIKQALIEMFREHNPSHSSNINSICGVVFFGVPSQGMNIESLIPMVGDEQPNRFLLESLGRTSAVLVDQGREFRETSNHENFKIVSFYETKMSPTAREVAKGRWKMDGPPATLVDVYSATQHRWRQDPQLPIDQTHSELVKFRSNHDEYYKQVLKYLIEFKDDANAVIQARSSAKNASITQSFTVTQSDCLRSLAFEELESRWHKIIDIEDTTCDWLLRHDKYESWTQQKQGMLWIRGKPGAGKSTLMKFMGAHLHSRKTRDTTIVSFFFNARGSDLERSPFGMLRSLLHQLLSLGEFHEHLAKLSTTYENRCSTRGAFGDKWYWAPEELQKILSDTILEGSLKQPTLILIDALDESGEIDANKVVMWFKKLITRATSRGSQLRICFSCRLYPIITWEDNDGLVVSVDGENGGAIRMFAEAELANSFKGADLEELLDVVLGKAKGVFQWIAVVIPQLQTLRRKGKKFKVIYESLHSIPSDLTQLYEDLLQKIDDEDRDQTIKLFQWICFAVRPITTRELQHAMAMDVERRYEDVAEYEKSDEFLEEEAIERQIIDLSKGLAEMKNDGSGEITVQLIHQSVNDYLMKTGLRKLGAISPGNSVICAGHFLLSRSCIQYLSLDDRHRWTKRSLGHALEQYPLLGYAAMSWIDHCKILEEHHLVQDDLLECFRWRVDDTYQKWLRIHESIIKRFGTKSSLLHIATRVGLNSLAAALLEKDLTLTESRDSKDLTPLHWAVSEGRFEVVKILFERNWSIVNVKEKFNQETPLHLAARLGRFKILKLLFEQDAVVHDQKNMKGSTILHLSAEYGHFEIAELVLRKDKALLNTKDARDEVPLHLAAVNNHTDIVDLLLRQNRIVINGKGHADSTPLHLAAMKGHMFVAFQLLQRKDEIQVNEKDSYGRTPLHLAASLDHESMVKLLVVMGKARLNETDMLGSTPLHHAVRTCNVEIVEFLLRQPQIEVNIEDEEGKTPLCYAILHIEIEKLLREAGARLRNLDYEDFGAKFRTGGSQRHGDGLLRANSI